MILATPHHAVQTQTVIMELVLASITISEIHIVVAGPSVP